MRKAGPILIAVIGIAALIICFVRASGPDSTSADGQRTLETKLGLGPPGRSPGRVPGEAGRRQGARPEDLEVIRQIIERRVNATGVSSRSSRPRAPTASSSSCRASPTPTRSASSSARPAASTSSRSAARRRTWTTPSIPSSSRALQWRAARIRGDRPGPDERPCRHVHPQGPGREAVRRLHGEAHRRLLRHRPRLAVISAPQIEDAIPGGHVQITSGGIGGYPLKEATNLVTVLQFGSLPFPIQELSNVTISATLGEQFLQSSLLAGAIGIGLVITFMLIYYRLPGAVASFALIYYTLVVLAIFRLIPVTLTLAGIAGFVLSVGMAVDANILIFERMKEEMRLGKSLPAAVEAGFGRAWNSILDSNVSSLITATILYLFGSSVIRGFALVLIIGVLVSMFSAIIVTRTILRWVVTKDWARRARLWGVTDDEFVARGAGRPTLRREARRV
jgi:protein-export SecD/SecF family membrane protein